MVLWAEILICLILVHLNPSDYVTLEDQLSGKDQRVGLVDQVRFSALQTDAILLSLLSKYLTPLWYYGVTISGNTLIKIVLFTRCNQESPRSVINARNVPGLRGIGGKNNKTIPWYSQYPYWTWSCLNHNFRFHICFQKSTVATILWCDNSFLWYRLCLWWLCLILSVAFSCLVYRNIECILIFKPSFNKTYLTQKTWAVTIQVKFIFGVTEFSVTATHTGLQSQKCYHP